VSSREILIKNPNTRNVNTFQSFLSKAVPINEIVIRKKRTGKTFK
jgi:hypothetical protein